VALSRKRMTACLSTPLNDLDFRVLVIDGVVFHDHTVLIVLGSDSDGKKHVLGLREGSTENSGVAKALLRDLLERGLDPERARVFVTDGSKALHAAIDKVFGPLDVLQRCQIHKRRNILDHLPALLAPYEPLHDCGGGRQAHGAAWPGHPADGTALDKSA
jgi:transposase-like protein